MYILTADIGGTFSRFALFNYSYFKLSLLQSVKFASQSSMNFEDLLKKVYNYDWSVPLSLCELCVFAVAGQVQDHNYAYCPNLKWTIDLKKLASQDILLAQKAILINDFLALAWSSLLPEEQDLLVVQNTNQAQNTNQVQDTNQAQNTKVAQDTKNVQSMRAFIGAGTGFGSCSFLTEKTQDGSKYRALASENGHSLFAFQPKEFSYANFLLDELKFAELSIDLVLSARGLESLHFYHHKVQAKAPDIISQLSQDDPVFQDFTKFYARAARHFALQTLCFGGLYIAGGLAQKNNQIIANELFLTEFLQSQSYSKVLQDIPIYLINSSEAAHYGAAMSALNS